MLKGLIWAAVLALATLGGAQAGAAQEAQRRVSGEAPVVAEARAFMAAYARELAAGDRSAIAARYDRRGAHFLGGGQRTTMTHAQIAARYAGPDWDAPAAFAWRDLLFEPLGDEAMAVTGLFEWTETPRGSPRVYSYTGLLIRQDGVLRIRIEDEDSAPEPRRP